MTWTNYELSTNGTESSLLKRELPLAQKILANSAHMQTGSPGIKARALFACNTFN